jgi:hypothetical protein
VIEKTQRNQSVWALRMAGVQYKHIAAILGVTPPCVRMIALRTDARLAAACEVYEDAVTDPVAYGVWHTFTHEGREGI